MNIVYQIAIAESIQRNQIFFMILYSLIVGFFLMFSFIVILFNLDIYKLIFPLIFIPFSIWRGLRVCGIYDNCDIVLDSYKNPGKGMYHVRFGDNNE